MQSVYAVYHWRDGQVGAEIGRRTTEMCLDEARRLATDKLTLGCSHGMPITRIEFFPQAPMEEEVREGGLALCATSDLRALYAALTAIPREDTHAPDATSAVEAKALISRLGWQWQFKSWDACAARIHAELDYRAQTVKWLETHPRLYRPSPV